jgi:hypothetical protein
MFRNFENVAHDANLAIHCLLLQIADRKERFNGRLPPVLFIQMDGGSENVNQWMIATLELLVAKGVFKMIYFNRLPVGHTHEGIIVLLLLLSSFV